MGKRILIVGPNWMGDLLFLTPAIRAIRRSYPDSYIACLCPPRGADLLKTNPHIQRVIPQVECRGLKGLLSWWPLVQRLKAERFDTVFLFHRSFSRTLACWAAEIRNRIGYRTWKRGWLLTQGVDPASKDSVHKAATFLRMLEKIGILADGFRYDVGLLPEDHQAAEALLGELGVAVGDRLVALHPGANWRLKRWPADRFAEVADALRQRYGTKVLLIGGPEDLPLAHRVIQRMKSRPIVATGKTSFRQLGALLARTRLLISNDSGPLHLGMAVGIPTIGLFGPTDPKLTGPLNGAKAVALFGSIGCPVPCYQLRCPVNLCMSQITVEEVLAAAGRFL
jgi:lipopolysaccharide heptosyltransferase II